jgi:dihydropyrimidinase
MTAARADTSPFDLVIRGGTVATDTHELEADVAIRGERIAAVGPALAAGRREIDARGKLVLPGGVDSHTHIEQVSSFGIMCADDFYTATVSAAYGGTTTVMCFCAQHREDAIPAVLADYAERARTKAVIDYAFHLIVANPDEVTLARDLPAAIAQGVRSFKIFTTYERMRLTDRQILDVMAVARKHGGLVMVHAENDGVISWLGDRMIEQGNVAPRYHGICHTRGAECEAIQRVAMLAELIDVPVLIVHVSTIEGIEAIRSARNRGVKIYGETCPQYLFLTARDLDRPGLEGAMFCCSPPPRDEAAQEACWRGLADGTLSLYSSDHAPYRFDGSGKLPKGEKTTFKEMANGVPGLELRLPLLFSFGYRAGRMSLPEFVALTSTRHAQIYGCHPQKGTIAVGSDADIAIWDPERRIAIAPDLVHDNVGYTPYTGRELQGWPVIVISRGEVIIENGALAVERGRGRFIARAASEATAPTGRKVAEMAQLEQWGTPLKL